MPLPKAQQAQRLSALTNVIAFESYHKFIQIQLHNIDQTWAQKLKQAPASKSWPYFSFEDLTKIQLQSFRFNFSLRLLTKFRLQNPD